MVGRAGEHNQEFSCGLVRLACASEESRQRDARAEVLRCEIEAAPIRIDGTVPSEVEKRKAAWQHK